MMSINEPERYKNVFVINNATQYFNALEAKYFYNSATDVENILVIVSDQSITLEQLKNVIDPGEWDSIQTLSNRVYIKIIESRLPGKILFFFVMAHLLLMRIKLDKLISNNNFINLIAVGNYYNAIFRHAINVTISKHRILLDDGTNTFTIFSKIISNERFKEYISKKTGIFYKYFVGFHEYCDYNNIRIFTCLPVHRNSNDYNQLVDTNEYTYLRRKNLKDKAYKNTVYFLGTPDILRTQITIEKYMEILKAIRSYYGNYELYYIPHKYEERVHLHRIQDVIEVKYTNKPIELYLIDSSELPVRVASFHSSALFFIKAIFQDLIQVESIYINPQRLKFIDNPQEAEILNGTLDKYDLMKINIVKILDDKLFD
jgi:hypothetical protein